MPLRPRASSQRDISSVGILIALRSHATTNRVVTRHRSNGTARVLRLLALLLGVALSTGVLAPQVHGQSNATPASTKIGGRVPRPFICTQNCVNPVTVSLTPGTSTDTLITHSETIKICANPIASDSAKFNGTAITGFTTSNGCASKTANYTLVVGTNRFQVWGCSGFLSGNQGTCTSGSAVITHPALGVAPKGATDSASAGATVTQNFTVSNYTTANETYALTVSCAGSGVSGCSAPSSVPVNAASHSTVQVSYQTSSTVSASGTIKLKATASGQVDSAIVTIVIAGPLTVSTIYTNQDDQDMSWCAATCFAATASMTTVPYISRGAARSVTLAYHGDRVAVRPVVYADVTVRSTALKPTQLELQAQVNGSWATFTNGESVLHFANHIGTDSTGPFRLAGAIDESSLHSGAYGLKLVVTAIYADQHTEQYTDSSHVLAIVNTRASWVARGWAIVGLPYLYSYYYPDGHFDQSRLMVPSGDGSAVVYNRGTCTPACWNPPRGVFSQIVERDSAGGFVGFTRLFSDSSEELYNNTGQLAAAISRTRADTVLYTYDGTSIPGRLTRITDPQRMYAGSHTYIQLNYGTYGLQSIIEPRASDNAPNLGRPTIITVNTSDSLLHTWTDPDGVTTNFGYDTQKRLSTLADRKGNTTTYKYEPVAWKLASVVSPPVPIDANSTGSTTTTPLTTTYQPWQVVDVPTGLTSTTPWPVSRADSVQGAIIDPAGNTSFLTVDRWGQPLRATDPYGIVTTFVNDTNGMPINVIHPTGAVDSYMYSGGLVIESQLAGQNRINYQYGAFAQPTLVSGGGVAPTYFYFSVANRGRIDSVRVGTGNPVTAYTYDAQFRVTKVVDPLGHTTLIGYDPLTGNQDSVLATPSNRYTKTIFDHYGRDSITIVTGDHLTQLHARTYDLMNRVVRDSDGVHPTVITYQYDSIYLTKLTDRKGQVYQTAFNALGWATSQTDPAGRMTTRTYTPLGLLATATNRRVQMTSYGYDKVGRPVWVHRQPVRGEADAADSIKYSLKGDTVTTWNAVSKDVTYYSLANGWIDSSTTTYVTHGFWYKRYYHHAGLGQVDSISMSTNAPGGPLHARHFAWDATTGVLDSLWIGTAAATRLGYNSEFMHSTNTYPTSVTRTDSISDVHGLVSSTYSANVSGSFNRSYAFDSAGRTTELDFPDGSSELYTFDALGHLNGRTLGTWNTTGDCYHTHSFDGYQCNDTTQFQPTQRYHYGFDAVDNFDTLTDVTHGATTAGVFGVGNTDSLWNNVAIPHDGDGDRQSVNASTPTQYQWSADGRLLQVVSGSTTINYDYNVAGQLTRRQVNGTDDRYYLWDNGQLIAILDQWAADPLAEYAYYPGVDRPFAQGVPSLSNVSYYEQDGGGNVIGVHTNGGANQSLRYDPWGNLESIVSAGTDTTQLRWKGLLWEGGVTQLYYARARWYDPATRRFLSQDPLGLNAGINQYAFAGGDPVDLSDPSGMSCADPEDGESCDPEGGATGGANYGGSGASDGVPQPWVVVTAPAPVDWTKLFQLPPNPFADGPLPTPAFPHTSFGGGVGQPTISANPTPFYKNSCITGAIGSAALQIGLDAIGYIPEVGGAAKSVVAGRIARAVGNQVGYKGVVATQVGAKIIHNVIGGAGITSLAAGIGDTFETPEGAASTVLGVAGLVTSFIPGANIVTSSLSIAVDLYAAVKAIGKCS
jgi:RHS repeat-associated protein